MFLRYGQNKFSILLMLFSRGYISINKTKLKKIKTNPRKVTNEEYDKNYSKLFKLYILILSNKF